MKKSKATKRTLLLSVLAMLLCMVMLVGTTFAWFTDSASTAVNKIQAGTLDIALEMKDANDGWVSAEGETLQFKTADNRTTDILWEPGATYALPAIRIVNKGNLWLKYKVEVAEGITNKDEDASTVSLLDVIDFYVFDSGEDIAGIINAIANGNARKMADYFAQSEATAENPHPGVSLAPSGSDDSSSKLLTIVGHMKESAGNEYQGLTLDGVAITVLATQYTKEHDSYTDQYDKDAEYSVAVFGTQIIESLNDPAVTEVVAGENIDMSDPTFQTNNYGNAQFNIPDGKTLDLNNNSIVRPDGGSGSGFAFKDGVTATVTNGYVINEGDSTAIDIEYGASATFENVTFKGNGDSMIRVRASGEGEKATAIFKNCTFENAGVEIKGMNGASEVDIQFINCTFTGSYYMYDAEGNKLTDKHGNVHYASYLFNAESNYLYGNVSFDNCTFDYDAHEASRVQNVIALYGCYQGSYPGKILNVTLNDVTITAKNAKPVSIDSRYASGLNLTETGTNSYTMNGVAVNYKGK